MSHVPYLSKISKINSGMMRVYEFHSDYVTEVPPGFKCVASSAGCENEMFISENQRVVSFQFHPEYSVEYIRWLERRWDSGEIKRVVGKEAVDEEHHHSLKILRNSIR
jgi:GMP synthase-like glutamine amidotransferase